jgi:hypothetical protein
LRAKSVAKEFAAVPSLRARDGRDGGAGGIGGEVGVFGADDFSTSDDDARMGW